MSGQIYYPKYNPSTNPTSPQSLQSLAFQQLSPADRLQYITMANQGRVPQPKLPDYHNDFVQGLAFQQLSPADKLHYQTMANQGRVPLPTIPYFVEQSQHNRNKTQQERDKYPNLYTGVPRLQGTGSKTNGILVRIK